MGTEAISFAHFCGGRPLDGRRKLKCCFLRKILRNLTAPVSGALCVPNIKTYKLVAFI